MRYEFILKVVIFLWFYSSRLKAKNLMYIKQILYILSSFIKCLGGTYDMCVRRNVSNTLIAKLNGISDFASG